MGHLVYVQSSGEFFNGAGPVLTPLCKGYSGAGAHKNNPTSECISSLGPIPRGWYAMKYIAELEGMAAVIRLVPDEGNAMCGRTGFLIHGDSRTQPGWASEGCIVVGDATMRTQLGNGFDRLHVIGMKMSVPQLAIDRVRTLEAFDSEDEAAGVKSLPFRLGSGFKGYADSFGARIIDHKALTESVAPEDSGVESRFGLVATQSEFESAFSVDASLSGSVGGFSANARAFMSRARAHSSTSVSVAFTKRVVAGVFRIAQYPIEEAAHRTSHDVRHFMRAYGSEVITGVGRGGACCYMFQYNFGSEREATEFRIAIKARYGPYSGALSASHKEIMSRAQASVVFCGYSTGTTKAPDLFPIAAELAEGSSYLFSRGFSDRMLAGLLDYFDTFQDHFTGNAATDQGYAQVYVERQDLAEMPALRMENQADIANEGRVAGQVARELNGQIGAVDQIIAELDYMASRLQQFNRPQDVEQGRNILKAQQDLRGRLIARRTQLVEEGDWTTTHNFVSELEGVPSHFCTADPEHRAYIRDGHGHLPSNRTSSFEFSIGPHDTGRLCRVLATVTIESVRHRPNGGSAVLQLIKRPFTLPAAGLRLASTLIEEAADGAEVVEEKRLGPIARGGIDVKSVGIVFLPADGHVYSVRVFCEGNFAGRKIHMETHLARQAVEY